MTRPNILGIIVPIGTGEIESLESSDLSFNNFSGNIPREGHLSTFNEASSFDNNPYLCREPLPIKCVTENPWKRH